MPWCTVIAISFYMKWYVWRTIYHYLSTEIKRYMFIQDHHNIEKLYYTAYPDDVLCIHSGSVENIADREDGVYPAVAESLPKRGS